MFPSAYRRNRIMGGVIYFDMLYIPPQPKKVAQWVICELEHPQVSAEPADEKEWGVDYRDNDVNVDVDAYI